MKIKLLTSAYEDLKKGRIFYESQAVNLGDYFFDSLFAEIDALTLYAGIHHKFFGYYRLLCHKFPYAIYYKIEEETIIVWRILDCRQDPQKTVKQLKQ